MPPNMSGCGGKNKKKKEKTAVHPVQQVQPQPQKPPTPDLSALIDDIEINKSVECNTQDQGTTVVTVEAEGITKAAEHDMFLLDVDNLSESSGGPVAPPRSHRISSSPAVAIPSSPLSGSPLAASPASRSARERTPSITYTKGQTVKPAVVPIASIVASVAELVHDAMPSQQAVVQAEKVEWVQFLTVDKVGQPDRKVDVILLGLTRGFQLWVALANGDMEEVMSERQGPIRAFVTIPNNIKVPAGVVDPFVDARPLMALVDAYSHVQDRQFCTVSVVSLSSKKVIRLPSGTTAYDEPVSQLFATDSYLVVCLSSRVIVYSSVTLQEVRSLRISPAQEGTAAVTAINGQLLAFADEKFNVDWQSCGGMDGDGDESPPTYTSQMMNAAKAFTRTVTSLGESVSGSSGTKAKDAPKGIITVVDLSIDEKDTDKSPVVAHWIAHMEPLAMCAWSPDGRLLMTADVNGSSFNVFSLLPHASSSVLGSVQHLYRLHRGNTAAKVVSTAFSLDCRWLAIATNHGTTHIFAICPYGGKPTLRTHGDHFTNKESRFLRSSGLIESADALSGSPANRARIHSGSLVTNKEHPAQRQRLMAKCAGNPRVGPHPPAILLTAVKKIRDPRISTDNLSAWATDLTPLSLSSNVSGKRVRFVDPPRVSLAFTSNGAATVKTQTLLIARAETGVICEYEVRPRQPVAKGHSEDAPRLDVTPLNMWTLHRTKNNTDIPLPLQAGSPLMTLATKDKQIKLGGAEKWIPHVEMCTYSGPARRLWLGPQFSFFEYNEDNSAELMTPSESRHSLSSMKSIPVVMGQKSSDHDDDSGEATRIECGSWVSQSSLSMPEGADISQKIADAMREVDIDHHHQNSLDDFVDAPSPRGDDELLQFDDI